MWICDCEDSIWNMKNTKRQFVSSYIMNLFLKHVSLSSSFCLPNGYRISVIAKNAEASRRPTDIQTDKRKDERMGPGSQNRSSISNIVCNRYFSYNFINSDTVVYKICNLHIAEVACQNALFIFIWKFPIQYFFDILLFSLYYRKKIRYENNWNIK